jgi:acetyl-CoA synthetase
LTDPRPRFDYTKAAADFSLEVPEDFNFAFDVLSKQAAQNDKTALIYIDRSGHHIGDLSYGDLDRASGRFANALLTLGVCKTETILVVLPRIPEWYHVLFGCAKMGAVAMPGTNLLTGNDLEYRIKRASAKVAVVSEAHADAVDAIKANCPSLEHLIIVRGARSDWHSFEKICAQASDHIDRSMVPATSRDDLLLIYFTSGTTAMPKMVGRDHAYSLAHRITKTYWQDLRRNDVHWTLTDTGWAKAAWGLLYPQILAGCAILLYDGEGFDLEMHLRIIKEHKVTTFCAPPTIYRLMAQADLSKADFKSLRHCFGAGEPLNPEAMRVWKTATGCDIYDGYGQTETINIVANFPGMDIRPGSMGRPCPGFEVDIIDDKGQVLADGEIGHIAIKITDPYPPGLFKGYYRDAKKTAEVFRNGWYYTGDTATRDKDGYIWFVGRSDDIISSSGYRISPFEVESALVEHPGVVESAVVAKPDPIRGEIVKAYVVLANDYQASDALAVEIQDFVKQHSAPYKYPREIEFKTSLPKTISGKIRRVELRVDTSTKN